MRVLIVKTSSLGDVIHTLPALTDAVAAYPEITFDWVVEEPFQEVPTWHPAVKRVIPIALRRWRKQKIAAFRNGEYSAFIKNLRKEKYDYIIDAQGLLKSVMVTLLGRGKAVGLSWHSARESVASLFYRKRAVVPWMQHAVLRARSLFAQSLNYSLPATNADYGIDHNRLTPFPLEKPYYVLLHGTTWDTKHWPEEYWIEAAQLIIKSNNENKIQLLWGNTVELERAQRIANAVPNAFVVARRLKLGEVARVLSGAKGIISVDTGLGHLAAALSVPTVSIYGPSNPKLCGTLGENQLHLAADFPCAPCYSRTCLYQGEKPVDPPCFTRVLPLTVWENLNKLVAARKQEG